MIIDGSRYVPLNVFIEENGYEGPSDMASRFARLSVANLSRSTESSALYALIKKNNKKFLAKYKDGYSRYNSNIMLYEML